MCVKIDQYADGPWIFNLESLVEQKHLPIYLVFILNYLATAAALRTGCPHTVINGTYDDF